MIQVHITSNTIDMVGHAPRPEDDPPGQNLVCSAVSALTLTLIDGLKAIAEMQIESWEDAGDVRIHWDDPNDIGKALIDTWFIGIMRIQESYDNTITII